VVGVEDARNTELTSRHASFSTLDTNNRYKIQVGTGTEIQNKPEFFYLTEKNIENFFELF